jgi:hypothetical protein
MAFAFAETLNWCPSIITDASYRSAIGNLPRRFGIIRAVEEKVFPHVIYPALEITDG